MIEYMNFACSLNVNECDSRQIDLNLIKRELCFPLFDMIAQEKEDIATIARIIRETCTLQSSRVEMQSELDDILDFVLQLAIATMRQYIPEWLVEKINNMCIDY